MDAAVPGHRLPEGTPEASTRPRQPPPPVYEQRRVDLATFRAVPVSI